MFGRAKQVPCVETVQVLIRTESRKMELTLEIRAVELGSGTELGSYRCSASQESSWEEGEDSSAPQSGMVEALIPLEAIREGLRTSDLKAELKDHESQLMRAYRGKARPDGPAAVTDQTVRVVDFTSADITFDGGTNRGWQIGAIVRVVRQVPVLGLSGEVLGHKETEIARVKLVTVEDKFSIGQVLEIKEGEELGLGLVAKLAAASG